MTETRARLALAATVLCAATLWSLLGTKIEVPTVFGDELIYWDAARSLSAGGELAVRDEGYAFGPLYPALLAAVQRGAGSVAGYDLARLLGAMLFALAAVPAYLLARRLLPRPWSLACAALAVAVPSAVYTGFVTTEAAAYPAACTALLAIQLVAERPSARRQLAALGAIGVAAGIRLQLAALVGVLLIALAVRHLASRGLAAPTTATIRRLWPVWAVLSGALTLVLLRVATGGQVSGYGELWRSYDAWQVFRWSWYALGGLCLYLAIVPIVVGPAALGALASRANRGDPQAAAFVGIATGATVVLVAVVGAFSSTEFGVGFLHDRYLFYVVPLWIVLAAVWARSSSIGNGREVVPGVVLALALLGTLPTYLLTTDGGRQFDAVATAVPGRLAAELGRVEPPRWLLLVAVLAATGFALLARRVWSPALLVLVTVVFLANAGLVWDARIDSARNTTFATLDDSSAAWVDRAVPAGADVATLYGAASVEVRDAFRLTEFFNGTIVRAYDLGGSYAPTLASDRVRIGADGQVLAGGESLPERLLVTDSTFELNGERIARGTKSGLVLWQLDEPPRVLGETP